MLRGNDAPEPEAKKRGGEKEGGGRVMPRHVARPAGRAAARGRYRRLRPLAADGAHGFAKAAAVVCTMAEAMAGMFEDLRKGMEKALLGKGLHLASGFELVQFWQDSAGHDFRDDAWAAPQDHGHYPQP